MQIVRWGIIGAGRIAKTFSQDCLLVDHAEVSAVASRCISSAKAFAGSHQIKKYYGSYDALLKDKDIDAVYVATPHNFHYAQCADAIRDGKHVLCEKPFTVSAKQCQELMVLASEHKVFLMEAMWTYFLPAIQQAKSWVEQGRIGDIVQIKADFGYPVKYSPTQREYNADLSGGCLLEMGIYPLALAYLFTGQHPQKWHVKGRFAPNGVEDDLVMMAEYEHMTAELATSFRARLPNFAFIVGTQGYITIPDFFRAHQCSLHVLDETHDQFEDNRKGSGFEFQISAASHDILAAKHESEIMPLSASLSLQQQMDAILLLLSSSH